MSTDPEIFVEVEGFESTEAPKPVREPEPAQVETRTLRPVVEDPWETPKGPVKYFKVGQRVCLTSLVCLNVRRERYYLKDGTENPLWGGRLGHVGGTVIDHYDHGHPFVKWDSPATETPQGYPFGAALAAMTAEQQLMSVDNQGQRAEEAKRKEQAEKDERRRKEDAERDRKRREIEEEARRNLAEWPDAAKTNREAWLAEAARRLAIDSKEVARDKVLFSTGYGKGGTRGSQPFNISDSNGEGAARQVFVRPSVYTKLHAAAAVYGALLELGIDCRATPPDSWPEYPQPEAREDHKSQPTRLIKCVCPKCGFTMRTTARWIDKAGGTLICPDPHCDSIKITISKAD